MIRGLYVQQGYICIGEKYARDVVEAASTGVFFRIADKIYPKV